MATTKREYINAAFSDIGLAGYVFDISASEITDALNKLDRMVAQWDSRGIRIGYLLPSSPSTSNPDDDSGVPDIYSSAIVQNLAMLLAPSYGKTITQDMRINARMSYNDMISHVAERDLATMQFPNNLPYGAGNKPYRNGGLNQYFQPEDRLQAGPDSFLET